MTVEMNWPSLLSETRVRSLHNEAASFRSAAEARTEFERDYGRTVFSTPVRRLHDKAQVFPLDPHDAIRTRLTHSLEVSTVARNVVRAVGQWLLAEKELRDDDQIAAIETIAATCGLLHDIGNPPFGHSGEQAIQTWYMDRLGAEPTVFGHGTQVDGHDDCQYVQDFARFEGNAQTIRLISRLQFIADPYGLNLTAGTFSAAIKYLAPSNGTRVDLHDWRKPGYFASEAQLVEQVQDKVGTGRARNPIAFLVEACDDAVYSTVDVEDGIRKGVVSWPDVEQQLLRDAPELGKECLDRAEEYIDRASPPLKAKSREEALAQMFRTFAIGKIVPAVIEAFKDNYAAIMRGEYHSELVKDSAAADLVAACKAVAKGVIYKAEEILRLELMGRKVIHDLLSLFWEGVSGYSGQPPSGKDFASKLYLLNSHNYRSVFEQAHRDEKLPHTYLRLQLATDYICGMTDSFACALHRKLRNL